MSVANLEGEAMKKTIKAWAVFGPGKTTPYRNTIAVSKGDALYDFRSKDSKPWKYFYRKGYRVRCITITVGD